MQLLARQFNSPVEAVLVGNPDRPFAHDAVFAAVFEADADAMRAGRRINSPFDRLDFDPRLSALIHFTSSLVRFASTKVAAWAGRASDGCGPLTTASRGAA